MFMYTHIYSKLINLRNIYKYQSKRIIIVEKENKIINNFYIKWFVQILSLFNLYIIIYYFGFNYLYEIDDMFFYNTVEYGVSKQLNFSVITNCLIYNDLNNKINFTDKILKYSLDVPLYIIMNVESLDPNFSMELSILRFGRTKNITFNNLEEIKNKKLCDILL